MFPRVRRQQLRLNEVDISRKSSLVFCYSSSETFHKSVFQACMHISGVIRGAVQQYLSLKWFSSQNFYSLGWKMSRYGRRSLAGRAVSVKTRCPQTRNALAHCEPPPKNRKEIRWPKLKPAGPSPRLPASSPSRGKQQM